jgi:hypothetical protein
MNKRIPLESREGGSRAALRAAAAAVAIVVLYGVQVWTANDSAPHGPTAMHAALMLATGIVQSAALFVLYRALRATRMRAAGAILAAAVAVMLLLSAFCANTDDDAAAYVGYAKLPAFTQAYRPPAGVTFSGNGFEAVSKTWPRLLPLVYGPLWLAEDRLVVGHAPTYAAALGILRAVNVLCLIGLLIALRRLGFDRATLAVVALNPMLYFYYIVQAHNDLLPILLVAAGMVVARRRPLLGALIAGAAGLMKIAFVAIAVAAYAGRRSPRTALACAALSLAVTVAVSWLFGGADYLRAMAFVGHEQIAHHVDAPHVAAAALHAAVALIAAGALAWAIARGTFAAPAAYSFSAVSTIVYPWYLGWCIPYALRVPGFAATFFITLPAVAHFIDPHFPLYATHTFAVLAPYYVAIIALVAREVWLASTKARSGLGSSTGRTC